MNAASAALHDPARMREADAGLLSLALIEARNATLRWLALFEAQPAAPPPAEDGLSPALWLAGHAAWFQERWIARNLQRSRGAAADTGRAPLASIEVDADRWWDPAASTPAERWTMPLPGYAVTRAYLVETLETTGDLLAQSGAEGLHWFRVALAQEDALVERYAALAQALGLRAAAALCGVPAARALREALPFSPQPGGVPTFEIDAQPVCWAQFAEFAEDGGYDEPAHWQRTGWQWLQAHGRRSPRDVERLRRGVLLRRFGVVLHVPATEPACGLSWHEADAWCRWAGRRLPLGVEWETAARRGAARGFAWGDVPEWLAGRPPGEPDARPQRGQAWMAPRRLLDPAAVRAEPPGRDAGFAGFRSCALD